MKPMLSDSPDHLETVIIRKPNIENDEMGFLRENEIDGLRARRAGPDDFNFGIGRANANDKITGHVMIFDDGYSHVG